MNKGRNTRRTDFERTDQGGKENISGRADSASQDRKMEHVNRKPGNGDTRREYNEAQRDRQVGYGNRAPESLRSEEQEVEMQNDFEEIKGDNAIRSHARELVKWEFSRRGFGSMRQRQKEPSETSRAPGPNGKNSSKRHR
jgi:hypothetical protein